MTKVLWLALAGLLLVVVPVGVQTWRLETVRRALARAELAPATAAAESARVRVETVTVKLAAAQSVVTRVLTRVRVDTLLVAPRTAAETTTAVRQLGSLAIAHDSLQRACSALQVTCEEYRVAAALRDSAQARQIQGLEAAMTARQPNRLRAIWEKLDGPVLFVAGALVGSWRR